MPSWRALLPYIPAVMLCLVATVQVRLTRTEFLTPWKGGGFGMFSTSDQVRRVRAWTLGRNGMTAVTNVEDFGDAQRAGTFPSDRMLRNLADHVASAERSDGHLVDEVRIQVWRYTYDVHTMKPDSELLRDASLPIRSRR